MEKKRPSRPHSNTRWHCMYSFNSHTLTMLHTVAFTFHALISLMFRRVLLSWCDPVPMWRLLFVTLIFRATQFDCNNPRQTQHQQLPRSFLVSILVFVVSTGFICVCVCFTTLCIVHCVSFIFTPVN